MSEATEAEKKAHVLGLVKATARLLAHVAYVVSEIPGVDEDMRAEAANLRRMVDDLERGVFRGHVNDNVRTAPGALVSSAMAQDGARPPFKIPSPKIAYDPHNEAIVRGEVRDPTLERRAESMAELGAALAELPDAVVDEVLPTKPRTPKPRTPTPRVLTSADYDALDPPPKDWAAKKDEPTE